MKLKTKFIFGISIIVISSMLLLTILVSKYVDKMIDNEEESYSSLLQESIEAQMHAQLESARMSVLTISENTQIQALFAQRDREEILKQLLPVYEKLQTEVSQIQFHLPDSTSFLRLHMPEKYGDSLSDFRFTVNEANANLKIVQGLEEGVGGYGFRVVVPMFNEGQQIAKATEISQSKMVALDQSSDYMEQMKNQILDELQGLAAIAEENSASTQEVAASVEEQTASLEIISNSSYGLTQLALKLNELVDRFKS